ncbi:glucan endo-1,3-beta-glucosidase 12-like isoform X2 [Neltuma alba]|uniref:glucan endo-1,3-beta-glucosidase 12-like isoform X2 n=1 Tax=Neltuma alba TaxID=207710 RepID=UPI0010A453B1|nr:glucan endo-1,3-beta-glucosidase 12-like isoform X2 [Prosopis alba]
MANRNFFCVLLLLLTQFLSSGSSKRILMKESRVISTTQKDITTPITTVPNLVPIISSPSSSSSSPILNPNSSPDTVSPASTLPYTTTINAPTTPNSTNSSVSPPPPSSSSSSSSSGFGVSWCIASPSASQMSLQVALDYACGYGGADCSEIQPNGRCYNPSSLRDHASFAFNSYYQKNPVPNSCNFGGLAVITSTNPSSGPCQYPSISTSTSVLNTTNSMGANVFGSVPVPMTPYPSAAPSSSIICFPLVYVTVFLIQFLSSNTFCL